jgi:hypothetical protein
MMSSYETQSGLIDLQAVSSQLHTRRDKRLDGPRYICSVVEQNDSAITSQ